MITTLKNLLNLGSKSKSMNVASLTTFSYMATNAEEEVWALACLLLKEGSSSFAGFGSLSALTNGVLIQVTQSGETRTIATIKDNADLCKVFRSNQFGNGAVLSILGVATAEGFGGSNNVMMGCWEMERPIRLLAGDSIQAVVQDDLSAITLFEMSAEVSFD